MYICVCERDIVVCSWVEMSPLHVEITGQSFGVGALFILLAGFLCANLGRLAYAANTFILSVPRSMILKATVLSIPVFIKVCRLCFYLFEYEHSQRATVL